jgi:hypothetical protein
MATLTFWVGDHIFFICFLGFLVENIWKYFENFPHFLFKLTFLKSPAKNIANSTFYLFQICPRFVSSIWFIVLIIIFAKKLRFGRNRLKPSLIKNKINYFSRTCQIVKPSCPPNLIFFIHLMKNIIFDMPKFRFFWNFKIFDFDVEIVSKQIK